jgi:hypothetical protein
MEKLRILFLAAALLFFSAGASAQTVRFRKVIGNSGYDKGMCAIQCIDTGYVAVGSTSSAGSGSTDAYIIRTDSMGNVTRMLTFGGINIDKANSVRQTADSGFVICGYSNSFGPGGYDVYLVKLDKYFQKQWEKVYGGDDWDFGNSVKQTSDGGYIICGSTYSFGAGDEDYFLVKTNPAGDTVWTKTFGGASEDVARSVVQTADGGYLLTGYTMSMGDTNGDIYTVRTDAMGDTLWTSRYGGSGADKGNGIFEESATGNIFIGGETTTGSNTDATVLRFTSLGAYSGNYIFPAGAPYDKLNSIAQDSQGKFVMAGITNSFGVNGELFLLILNNDLSFFYATTFGTSAAEEGNSAEGTFDNGFIICGTTTGFNNGLDDIYLIKTDTMGLANLSGSETFFTVGINETVAEKSNSTFIYPNPATDHVYIRSDTDEKNVHLVVSDLLGKKILERDFNTAADAPSFIEFPELGNGAYFVTVTGKTTATTKLIINR